MGFTIWFLGIVLACVISLILTLLFNEPLKQSLSKIVILTGILGKREKGIEGVWVATFSLTRNNKTDHFTEVIEIKQNLGMVVGRIIPDPRNYPQIQVVHNKKPIRVRGGFVDRTYFTGIWFHPLETNRFHGSFQLVLQPTGTELRGKWTGYSESMNEIETGDWLWYR